MCDNYFDIRSFGAVMTTGKAEMESDAEVNKGRRTDAKQSCGTAAKCADRYSLVSLALSTRFSQSVTRSLV